MRAQILAMIAALAPMAAGAAPDAGKPFDGPWSVRVSCADASGAMGFSYEIAGAVRDGMFHGERLHPGEPGWLVIDGPIAADGHADLYAKGLVGAAQFAVGSRPKGTPYGYHVDARFEGDHALGRRVEGRRCDLDFKRR